MTDGVISTIFIVPPTGVGVKRRTHVESRPNQRRTMKPKRPSKSIFWLLIGTPPLDGPELAKLS